MTSRIERDCPASKVKQLQELIKAFNLRWAFNPYPRNPNKADELWVVGVDYGNATYEQKLKFDSLWSQLNRPILETVRTYSLFHKTVNNVKGWFRYSRIKAL